MEYLSNPAVVTCLIVGAAIFWTIQINESKNAQRHKAVLAYLTEIEKSVLHYGSDIDDKLDDLDWLLFPELYEEERKERLEGIRQFNEEFSPEGLKKFMEENKDE